MVVSATTREEVITVIIPLSSVKLHGFELPAAAKRELRMVLSGKSWSDERNDRHVGVSVWRSECSLRFLSQGPLRRNAGVGQNAWLHSTTFFLRFSVHFLLEAPLTIPRFTRNLAAADRTFARQRQKDVKTSRLVQRHQRRCSSGSTIVSAGGSRALIVHSSPGPRGNEW